MFTNNKLIKAQNAAMIIIIKKNIIILEYTAHRLRVIVYFYVLAF